MGVRFTLRADPFSRSAPPRMHRGESRTPAQYSWAAPFISIVSDRGRPSPGRNSNNLNLARFGFLHLRKNERHDTILEGGANAFLLDLARKLKAARVVADIVLGVDRAQTLIRYEIDTPFN